MTRSQKWIYFIKVQSWELLHKQSIELLTAPACHQNTHPFLYKMLYICTTCTFLGATERCTQLQSSQFQDKKQAEEYHGMKTPFLQKDISVKVTF